MSQMIVLCLTVVLPGSSPSVRTDLQISGVYPPLTTYAVYSQDGRHDRKGHEEYGIGAVAAWADRLWMANQTG